MRDALLGLLLLVLGTGAPPAVVRLTRGSDVVLVADRVQVAVRWNGGIQRFWVLRRYGTGLLALGRRVGRDRLLGSYVTGVNVTGNVTWRLRLPPDLPELSVWRLVATYQQELAHMFDLATLADQLGHYNLDTIGQRAKVLPLPPPDRAAALLCGDDTSSGPWEPDWPLQPGLSAAGAQHGHRRTR
jgi:hypothetical protein